MTKNVIQNTNIIQQRSWVWLVLLAVVLLTWAIRIRLLSVPLHRDEGEYAYAGQLMLQGIPPYEKAYNMKMPGIYAAYAGIMAIFGQTIVGIHLGLLFINVATTIIVFLLAKELFDPIAGLFAGAAFALLSAGPVVQGISANSEHFVILPALAGILLLYRMRDSTKLLHIFLAGLLLGLAFMMKQHGAAFILFAIFYLLASELRRRPFNWKLFLSKGLMFSAAVFLPFTLTCLILWHFGIFERFWFWTFDYARCYVSMVPFDNGLFLLKEGVMEITGSAVCLWSLAGIGLILLFLKRRFWAHSWFVSGFLICSFLAICPGLHFRVHYYILLLPAVAILAGVGASGGYEIIALSRPVFIKKFMPLILASGIFAFTFYQRHNYFFYNSPTMVSCTMFGLSDFAESVKIAKLIKENSEKTDTIAVLGSEPQICFYSDRHSATGYIYTYPLLEEQPFAAKMQDEMIHQIEQTSPKFLIVVGTPSSWLTRVLPDEQQRISTLLERYPLKYYDLIGSVDIISVDKAVYCWRSKAREYTLQSPSWMAILLNKRYGGPDNISWPAAGITINNRFEIK